MATGNRSPRELIAWVSPGVLIVIGILLFVIPVPPTSVIGVLLVMLGVGFLLFDYFDGGERGQEPEMGEDET